MPITKDPVIPTDYDENNVSEETIDFQLGDYGIANSIGIDMQEFGALTALQQLSDRLSAIQRDYIKTTNIEALNALADATKQLVQPKYSEVLNKFADTISVASQLKIQNIIKPFTNQYISQIQLLNTPLLSDSVLGALEKIQLPAMAFSKIATQTPMIEALTAAMVNMDYVRCFSIANDALEKAQISAPDVAFFKTTELAKTMKPHLDYPYGFATSLDTLNHHSAYTISGDSDLYYNFSRKGFLRKGHEQIGVFRAKEINVVCAAKDVFNSVDEEFITEQELMEFMSCLFNTPSFASNHPAGKKIYKFIQSLMSKDTKYKHGFDKDVFYHSRARSKEAIPFVNDEMLRAPIGVTGPGRYNNAGRSHYYFADTPEGSEAEIRKHNPDKIIQTVRLVPAKDIVLLDLSGAMKKGATFLRYLRFPLSNANDKTPREYLIPCYVAECCKLIGFDGIKYYGGKDYCNYVSWNDGYFNVAGTVSL